MPSAQNLVLLAQLKAKTRPLAGMVAGLLLRQVSFEHRPTSHLVGHSQSSMQKSSENPVYRC